MLGETSDERKASVPRDPRIRPALDHVATAFCESLTSDGLAHAAGMSRFHVSRLFREQVGKRPYRYVLVPFRRALTR